jgi:VanZ family protein
MLAGIVAAMAALFDFRTLAWLMFVAIIFATAAPIRWRPRTHISVEIERSVAFGLMAMMFIFAYPDDRRVVAIFCILGAVGTELLQVISPTRHPRINDALFKAMGATVGLVVGAVILQIAALMSAS